VLVVAPLIQNVLDQCRSATPPPNLAETITSSDQYAKRFNPYLMNGYAIHPSRGVPSSRPPYTARAHSPPRAQHIGTLPSDASPRADPESHLRGRARWWYCTRNKSRWTCLGCRRRRGSVRRRREPCRALEWC